MSALASGYVFMFANILIQFALTPFYLRYLGAQQFGVFMMLLSLINFASIGIGWKSGGLMRILGECWANNNYKGFRNTYIVGKYLFSLYAVVLVAIVLGGWWAGYKMEIIDEPLSSNIWLAGVYFILLYESATERLAFIGINRQATGSQLELLRVLVFVLLIWALLPYIQDLVAVWIAMMVALVMQRIASGIYWSKHVSRTGWGPCQSEMKPVLKRLAGRQGAGYASYAALLLVLQVDTMIVGFLGGPEAAGQFVLLWKIPETIGLLLWKIPATVEPRVIALDSQSKGGLVKLLFSRGRSWFMLLVVGASVLYLILGQWLAELWVGDQAPTERWMYLAGSLALFFNAIARWPMSFAFALIRLKPLVRVAGIEAAGKLILTVLLFPHFGIASPLMAIILIHVVYVTFAYQRIMMTYPPKTVPREG